MVVQTLSAHEQQKFISKTDWRQRAINAANLYLRTKHLYVNQSHLSETGLTYVFPKNVLKRFICISDLRIQVAAFLFGVSPPDAPFIKEVRALVMVPQIGTYQGVTLPDLFPAHPYLKDLEPLGWLHTQPSETHQLSAFSASTQAKLLEKGEGWDPETSVVITCSLTQGSVYLTSYKLTAEGYEWGKQTQEVTANPIGYDGRMFEKVQMILSDKFLGFFMVPEGGVWNYNFNGINFSKSLKYALTLNNPKDFYNEAHRPAHFLDFTRFDQAADSELPDHDNAFE